MHTFVHVTVGRGRRVVLRSRATLIAWLIGIGLTRSSCSCDRLRRAGRASPKSPGWLGVPPNLSALARPARSGMGVVLSLGERPYREHGPAIGGLAQLGQREVEGARRGGEAGVAAPVDQGGVGSVVARAE